LHRVHTCFGGRQFYIRSVGKTYLAFETQELEDYHPANCSQKNRDAYKKVGIVPKTY